MMSMPKVYLSGPMQHLEDEGRSWRQDVKREYPGIEWLDPLDKGIEDEKPEDPDFWADYELSQDLMDADKDMIDEADAVLLYRSGDVASHGGGREHEYAVQNGIPVFVWTTVDDPSPCLVADTVEVKGSVEKAVNALLDYFSFGAGRSEASRIQAAFERGRL